MPGIDEYLEEQRRRLQRIGDFVTGVNKPKPAAPPGSQRPGSQFQSRGNRSQDQQPTRRSVSSTGQVRYRSARSRVPFMSPARRKGLLSRFR